MLRKRNFNTNNVTLFLFVVAVDAEGSPVTVSWSGDSRRNIIVWMDHRAVKQAERINSFNSPVLQYCGGGVSPEMEPPKVGRSFLRMHYVIAFSLFELDGKKDSSFAASVG